MGQSARVGDILFEQAPRGDENAASTYWLLCRAASHQFALPLPQVIETMRTLPVEAVAGAPALVRGIVVIRGTPTPVIDAARLFDAEGGSGERLVTVRTPTRTVALAADAVVGVKAIATKDLEELPPLLRDVQTIAALKTLDEELVFFLQTTRVLPDDAFNIGAAAGGKP